MKLVGVLTTVLLLATPLAAAAQGHGGAARVGVAAHVGPGMGPDRGPGMGRVGGFHGPGPGRGFRFRNRFLVGGWPYVGWSGCGLGLDSDNCDGDAQDDPGAPPPGYADASMTGGPPCGAWVSRAGGYGWAPDACRDPPAAADPPHAAIASNECSDWVWHANLHRSVCRRPSRTSG
jgi:hypothetical protein